MKAVILSIFFILISATASADNNKIAINLIHPLSIKLSDLDRSENGYSLLLPLEIKIYHQLKSNLEFKVIQGNKELSAITNYVLEGYDSDDKELMILYLVEEFTGTNTLILRPNKNLTIPLARSCLVKFPGIGEYKFIGTFLFFTENREKYKVSSEPFILKIIE